MTRATAKTFGTTCQEHLVVSLAALLERGLIVKTRQGGKKPLGPTLYAITWQPIDDLAGKIQSGATTTASNAWATWVSGLPADQSTVNHRVCRQTTLGPPADQTGAISGLPADQKRRSIGSASGPPSRSWREGTNVIAIDSAEASRTLNGHVGAAQGAVAPEIRPATAAASPITPEGAWLRRN